MPKVESEIVSVAGRDVPVSNPTKVLFPQAGYTKLDLVRYYLAVAPGALRAAGNRPNVLVRYPNGIGGEFFYQKRAPESRPDWIEVVALQFPSGRTAEEVVPRDAAALAWMANLACLELHPHPVRADDLDHPDELRVDLDPVPGVEWPQIREVARVVRATLDDFGLVGWPKTSGSRGMHIYVRIERALDLRPGAPRRAGVRARSRAARARRSPPASGGRKSATASSSTTTRTRRIARSPAAYSVRPTPDARVSAPLAWDEVDSCDPADFTLATMPARFARGRRSAARHGRSMPARSTRCSSCRRGTKRKAWATRRGRRTIASSRARRRAWRRRARRDARSSSAGRDRRAREKKADALAGLERWKARHPEAAAHLSRPTCWWTRCAAASTPGRASASTCSTCRRAPAAAGTARSRRGPGWTTGANVSGSPARGAEDLLELVRSRDLELIVAAVARLLVGAPALEHRGMPEAVALHVVVLHLAHALDAQRLPRQILARAPAALAAWHARAASPPLCPLAPWMLFERTSRSGASSSASCPRLAMVNEEVTPTWCRRPRRRRAQQQRADELSLPFLCHRKPATTQSAVRACLILIIARLPG